MKTKSVVSKWDEKHLRRNRFIEAILIHMRRHINDDGYTFPSSSKIEYYIGVALHEICGSRNFHSPIDYGYGGSRLQLSGLEDRSKISQDILEILSEIFYCGFDPWGDPLTNCLDDYLMHNERIVDWQWFYGKGDLFKFKPGMRKLTEKDVKKYWGKKELEQLNRIGKIVARQVKEHFIDKRKV